MKNLRLQEEKKQRGLETAVTEKKGRHGEERWCEGHSSGDGSGRNRQAG